MALDYAQSAALMSDQAFRDRVKVACLKYATYMLDEATNTPAHNTRVKWAQGAMTAPDAAAQMIVQPVVMDGAVQQDGSNITDAALQSATENTINKML
jgi:hypothetical protein